MKLSLKYATLASSFSSEVMVKAKAEVETQIRKAALHGRRDVRIHATNQLETVKAGIITWLQNEGFRVEWRYDNRNGNYIHINF